MVVTRMFWHALDPGRPGRGCTLTIRGDGGKLAEQYHRALVVGTLMVHKPCNPHFCLLVDA